MSGLTLLVLTFGALPTPAFGQCNEVELLPEPLTPGSSMGYSVDVDGDRVVAGAPFQTLDDVGSALVYERGPGGWAFTQSLTPSNGQPNDKFGAQVAIEGDTILVSASVYENSLEAIGKVYVFEHTPTGWVETQILSAAVPSVPLPNFGCAVALEGDLALIGARGIDVVYVYERTPAGWCELDQLSPPPGAGLSRFGWNVALRGDRALIAAPTHDSGAGAGYVFERTPTGWIQVGLLTSSTTSIVNLGRSIGFTDDHVFLGTPFHDEPSNSNVGIVRVYEEGPTGWFESQVLLDFTPFGPGESLGRRMTAFGDMLAVTRLGHVVIYRNTVAGWTVTDRLIPDDIAGSPLSNHNLGDALGTDGQLLMIGAHAHTHLFSPFDTGAVYAYSLGDSENYCTSGPNSSGNAAVLSHTGGFSVAVNDFGLRADGCPPGAFGLFAAALSTQDLPFGNGNLCVAGEIFRLVPSTTVDGSGTLSMDFDLNANPFPFFLEPCIPIHFQFLFRDTAAGGAGFDLSNGLRVLFVN